MEDQKNSNEEEADMMLAFRIFDADNKGYIESAELRYIILNMDNKIPRDELNEMIASVKLDQDKRVSYQGTELSVTLSTYKFSLTFPRFLRTYREEGLTRMDV